MKRENFTVKTEAELCAAFIEQFNAVPGWTCYPETAGFDILVVHEDGRQIGVEAKLKLNAKVADQILPSDWHVRCDSPGPDHRMVIVGDITEASLGISRMLEMLGVHVLKPDMRPRRREGGVMQRFPDFRLDDWMRRGSPWQLHLHDWNPPERCVVPCVVPDVPAGVPAPLRLTPWKEAAIRVQIQLRRQGWITAKQIALHGISSTIWTTQFLQRGDVQGQWVPTDKMPNLEAQHPDAWAKIAEQELAKENAKPEGCLI